LRSVPLFLLLSVLTTIGRSRNGCFQHVGAVVQRTDEADARREAVVA
jgi:hypothetical protein